jgi:hypothetical protein
MGVLVRGAPARVLDVHVGWFLSEGDYYELLVVEARDGAHPEWVLEKYIAFDHADRATRSILEWTSHVSKALPSADESSSASSTSSSRSSSSPSSTTCSPSSSERSSRPAVDTSSEVDLDAILERLDGSMSGHVSDMGWKLLTHAERDICILVEEVRRLRNRARE